MTTPDQAFLTYLQNRRTPSSRDTMVGVLREMGLSTEAHLLSCTAPHTPMPATGSPWDGARVWVSAHPPTEGYAGQLWFDTIELTPMLLVPWEAAAQPIPLSMCYAWISLRPLQRWQWGAFAKAAILEASAEPPLEMLNLDRAPGLPATETASHLCQEEARLCASWFGKMLSGGVNWEILEGWSPAHAAAMWGPQAREWSQEKYDGDDSLRVVRTPQNFDVDMNDAYDELDDGQEPETEQDRLFYPRWAVDEAAGARTVVNLQLGLQEQDMTLRGTWHQLKNRLHR